MNLEDYAVKASDLVDFMNSKLSYETKDKTDRNGLSVSVTLNYKIPVNEFLEFIGRKAKPWGEIPGVNCSIEDSVWEATTKDMQN